MLGFSRYISDGVYWNNKASMVIDKLYLPPFNPTYTDFLLSADSRLLTADSR